jgi:D-alanyl-D-alanine carboxypeptidase
MKRTITAMIIALGTFVSVAQNDVKINLNYSKAAALDSILKHYAPNELTGTSIAVYSENEGWWTAAAGYADVKNKKPMDAQHLQYLQSVSKMYLAVEMLQLKEQGKVDFDQPITKYLTKAESKYITDADKVTVRMLLNHTSGIPEYNDEPDFLSDVMLHPLENFTTEDILKAIEGRPLQWAPGSKYRYVNTNYRLLALIGDHITGDHAAYIKKHIFGPLNLKNSFYGNGFDYLKNLNLPQSYWDIFNAEIPVDVTPLQQMTVVCSKGDDGIVCTTTDAVIFLKSLFEGKLLKPESFKEMMTFVKDENGRERYGMGMIHFDLGGKSAYGHGGGGIGAGCGLIYIPTKKVYAFYAVNTGVFANGKIADKAGEMQMAILGILLK